MSFHWRRRPWPSRSNSPAQYRKAAATSQRAFEQAGLAQAPDVQAAVFFWPTPRLGDWWVYARAMRPRSSRRWHWTRASRPRQCAVLAAGICGNGEQVALPLAQELSKKYPQDTLIRSLYQPLAKAFVALAAGQPQAAVDAAEPAKSYDTDLSADPISRVWPTCSCRCRSCSERLSGRDQAPAGSLAARPFYAQAQLGLARAYAMGGDKVNARKAYEAFFSNLEKRGCRPAHAGGGEEGIRCALAADNEWQVIDRAALIDCWHRWRSQKEHSLARTVCWRRLAPAAWARCIASWTRGWSARSR